MEGGGDNGRGVHENEKGGGVTSKYKVYRRRVECMRYRKGLESSGLVCWYATQVGTETTQIQLFNNLNQTQY